MSNVRILDADSATDERGEGSQERAFFVTLGDGDQESWMDRLGRTFEFPPYYGRNLDAFRDCFFDLQRFEGMSTLTIMDADVALVSDPWRFMRLCWLISRTMSDDGGQWELTLRGHWRLKDD
jgi:hypothetical protein